MTDHHYQFIVVKREISNVASGEEVIEGKRETMSVIGIKSCIFSREGEKSSLLNSTGKSSFEQRFPKNLPVSCKISGSGAGENQGTNGVSLSSKNKMEDYNTAMKRLMRSPYEYHHDLGM